MPVFECSRCNELTYSASPDSAQACHRCGDTRHRVLNGGFSQAREGTRDLGPGDHASSAYDDPALAAPFCARFLAEGIDRGERVMAVTPADLRAAIEQLLAPDVNALVEWEDAKDRYADFDADRVAAMYDKLIGDEPRDFRGLGIWDAANAEGVEAGEWDRYERTAHEIITGHGATVVCLYDTRGLDPAHLKACSQRHTLSISEGVVRRNESFEYQPA